MEMEHRNAEQASAGSLTQLQQAESSSRVANDALSQALTNLCSKIELDGTFAAGDCKIENPQEHLGVPASALASARKSIERTRKAVETMVTNHAATSEASSEFLKAEQTAADLEADLTIAQTHGNNSSGTTKALQGELKTAEKESARLEKVFDKAKEQSVKAQDTAAQVLSELKDIATTFADAIYATGESTTQRIVKAAQTELKGTARSVWTSWQSVKAASDCKSKMSSSHRKMSRAFFKAAASCKEARARSAAADKEYAEAVDSTIACQSQRSTCEAKLEDKKLACTTAEENEVGQKRKRDELKALLGETKQSLKVAKTAEREAASGRTSLYKHYAKANDGIKKELEAAKSSVKASADEEQKAMSAIQALVGEAYDANQVVEAYEAKRKPRGEES